jgi:hypothetical protein
VVQRPIEIDVDDDELLVDRVAAVDVAKAGGMVCTRLPHETITGRRVTKVWEVKADTRALLELVIIWSARACSGWCWNRRRTTGGRSSTSSPRGG